MMQPFAKFEVEVVEFAIFSILAPSFLLRPLSLLLLKSFLVNLFDLSLDDLIN